MTVSLIGIERNSQSSSSQDERTRKGLTYLVRCTSSLEDASSIQASGFVPIPGDFHPTQSTLRVAGIESSRRAGQIWEWTPIYENVYVQASQDRATIANPLNRPIRWRIVPQYGTQITEKNLDDILLTNSAGDMCFPLPERPKTIAGFMGTKNCATLPYWYRSLTDKLNSDTFRIDQYDYDADPKTLVFEPGDVGDIKVEAGISFFEVNFKLLSRDHWQFKRTDAGFYFIDDNDVRQRVLVDGEFATEMVPLDGAGGILDDPANTAGVELTDDYIDTASFAPILF